MRPISVNFHLTRACNANCHFCFATFRDVSGQIDLVSALAVIDALTAAGLQKLNFAGGEPTLHPALGPLVAHAKDLGLVTSLVTNGFRLEALLDGHREHLDWVGLSVDSACEETQLALGRGLGDHVEQTRRLATRCRDAGVRIKLNTVVTSLSWEEDMGELIRGVAPERWKVFQVLPMKGQNDERVAPLLIEPWQFEAFVARHRELDPIVEDNDAMRGSYIMVDPLGRFFGNATGTHIYSDPILEVGVEAALAQVGFREEKFEARGGRYAW